MKKSTQAFLLFVRQQIAQVTSLSISSCFARKNFLLLTGVLVLASASFANRPDEKIAWKSPLLDDGRRYLALMFSNDNEDDQYLDVIENGKNKGFNALYVTVRMDAVKCHNQQCVIGSSMNPNWNPANRSWTQTDAQIAKAKQLGMKIAIRIHLGNSDFGGNIRSSYLWGPGRLAADPNGNTELGGYNFTKFTLSSQPAVDSAKKFVQEVLNRYGYLEGESNLLFISFSNTSSQELEYDHGNLIDYSNLSKNEYTSWYQTNYGTPNPNVPTEFTSTEGKKWYRFRHCKLKDFVTQLNGVVRSHNTNIKIIHDVGSAFDVMSSKRGTLGFKSLAEPSDGFKVNDGWEYDHRFSMDILRGSLPGKMVMNETFLVNTLPSGYYSSFANDVFAHGGKFLSLVTVNNTYLNQYAGDWSSIASTWLNGTNGNMTPVNANGTINYTFNEILNGSFNYNMFSSGSRNIYQEWLNQYNANPSGGKPVNVVINDSELTCGGVNPCDFTPTLVTSNSNPQPNTSITLTASATGQNTGITYTWSQNGLSGTGTTRTFNAPTTPGTYSYTITASKTNCTSKTATVQISVPPQGGSGCIVNKVRLQFRAPSDCCYERLVGAKIQGSNNGGGSWTDLYTFTGNGNGSFQEFTFGNTTSYSSARFVASSTGWGELRELEFYNGTTKLTGTTFGTDNYANAFDGNSATEWHAPTSPGSSNVAGMNFTGCSTPTGCDFNVVATASPTSVFTSGPVSLSFVCTGANCNTATFNWSGQNISGNQNPKSINAPASAGNYTYTLTATKTGCTTKSDTAKIVVTTPSGGTGCIVNKVRLKFRQSGECCMDRLPGAKIQGSNNGTTWTDIYTFTTNGTGSWQDFPITNSTAYSSVRFQASATGWGELYELEFYKGTAKLTGTPFGVGNYANAFDGNLSTDWQVSSNPGTGNHAGLNNLGNCAGSPLVLDMTDPGAINNQLQLLVSPNPSNGILNAGFYLARGNKATIVINDLQGRTIYRQVVTGNGQHNEKIYLVNKSSGTFILRLETPAGVEVRKINIAR